VASPCRSVTSRRRQDSPTTNAASGASGEQERLTAVWACVYLYYQLKVKMIGGTPPRPTIDNTERRVRHAVRRSYARACPSGRDSGRGQTPCLAAKLRRGFLLTSRVHRCYLMIIQTRSASFGLASVAASWVSHSLLDAIVPQALTAVTIHMGSPSVGCGLTSALVTFCHPATGPK
jgi:hypothetical protein